MLWGKRVIGGGAIVQWSALSNSRLSTVAGGLSVDVMTGLGLSVVWCRLRVVVLVVVEAAGSCSIR
jgi:hypothetical protein